MKMITKNQIIIMSIKLIVGATLIIIGGLAQSLILSIFDYSRPFDELIIKSILPIASILIGVIIILLVRTDYEGI